MRRQIIITLLSLLLLLITYFAFFSGTSQISQIKWDGKSHKIKSGVPPTEAKLKLRIYDTIQGKSSLTSSCKLAKLEEPVNVTDRLQLEDIMNADSSEEKGQVNSLSGIKITELESSDIRPSKDIYSASYAIHFGYYFSKEAAQKALHALKQGDDLRYLDPIISCSSYGSLRLYALYLPVKGSFYEASKLIPRIKREGISCNLVKYMPGAMS